MLTYLGETIPFGVVLLPVIHFPLFFVAEMLRTGKYKLEAFESLVGPPAWSQEHVFAVFPGYLTWRSTLFELEDSSKQTVRLAIHWYKLAIRRSITQEMATVI